MNPGEFCWNELGTSNIQAAKDFYGAVFGWKFIDHDMGDATYTMIMNHDKQVGGIWAIPKENQDEIPPHWLSYILVEDVDASLAKVSKQGGSIVKPATAAGDFGRFAIIIDPTGAQFALWQPLT